MTRQRSFCVYCGCVITAGARACHNHAYLTLGDPSSDRSVPPDPAASLPTLGKACISCEGSGIVYPDLECANCDGSGRVSRQLVKGKAI